MRLQKLTIPIDVFDYTYNEVNCSVIFNPDYTNGFSLTFFEVGTAKMLKLPVRAGYNLEIQNTNFHLFCVFFKIQRKKGAFSIRDFFDHLNSRIPTHPTKKTPANRALLVANCTVEEADKIHFDHLINWAKARAKNPLLKKGRSPKNLEKTKLLYPHLYAAIKDYDISVAYSADPSINEQQLINTELEEKLS